MISGEADLQAETLGNLDAAAVHLEDLEIFVGQRSRMHPGPGWAVALAMVRRDLAEVKAEIAVRRIAARLGERKT